MRDAIAAGMRRLEAEADVRKRRLLALGLLTRLLAPSGIRPILIGGAALEFYTAGGYATADVDLALPSAPEVDAAFDRLGFEREGRYWHRMDLDLLFEAPAAAGLPGETAPRTEVEVEGLPVEVIGVEDLLVDRLRAWVRWRSDEDGRWCSRLSALYGERMDWAYIERRVAEVPEETAAVAGLRRAWSGGL